MIYHREDSIKDLKKRKNLTQLANENEQIRKENKALKKSVSDLQIAMAEILGT